MKQYRPFSDIRHNSYCAGCNRPSIALTREHIPPKIFLDKPYPENLQITETCSSCNVGMSLDEEYLACWIECARVGTTNPNELRRRKIQKTLSRKPALQSKIEKGMMDGLIYLEMDRAKKVIEKLARCHVAYELSNRAPDEEPEIGIESLNSISGELRREFESAFYRHTVPEIGSRAFQRQFDSINPSLINWVTVQNERYRFIVYEETITIVRIVMSEYLAAEIVWPE
ncbi:hypothetical protein [Candidatus Leptofilum sp.]|uniref:hypothetical protein n=1 Tax=Candidatus Leptofilum sp. TaxID=3241576 RepID=UPI003B5B5311